MIFIEIIPYPFLLIIKIEFYLIYLKFFYLLKLIINLIYFYLSVINLVFLKDFKTIEQVI